MARGRKRAVQNDALVVLVVVAIFLALIVSAVDAAGVGDWRGFTTAIGADLMLVGLYLGFLFPRQCGAERATRPGPCGQRAHGVLNGCRHHPFAGLRSLIGKPTSVHDSGTADPVYGRSKARPPLRTARAEIVVKESRAMMYMSAGQLIVGFLGVVISAVAL